ncbi:MAG: hypothetical protein PHX20_04645 [Candidatus Omnitrophica bacterium]|nr:hypothetical protein [Candidatus Omnitrophota bacterium]MDD5436814.1 hypothetical protein [Candidatus Omnitrophota bacterium]
MPKRYLPTILVTILLSFQQTAYAQYDDTGSGTQGLTIEEQANKEKEAEKVRNDTRAGMRQGYEIKKIGGLNMLVPEGTKFYKEGAQIKMEEEDAYSARRFKEMDTRLQKAENRIRSLEHEIGELRSSIESIRKAPQLDKT